MNRLRQLREEKGMTQNALAKLWNTAPSSLSCWENGTNEMDYSTLSKAADFYKVSIDYILGRDNMIDNLTKEEQFLVSRYRDAPPPAKKFIIDVATLTQELY